MPFRLGPSAGRKAPRDRVAVLWTRSEPCSGRFTAVPSKNLNAGFMPCIAITMRSWPRWPGMSWTDRC